jgi:hypothetical protein
MLLRLRRAQRAGTSAISPLRSTEATEANEGQESEDVSHELNALDRRIESQLLEAHRCVGALQDAYELAAQDGETRRVRPQWQLREAREREHGRVLERARQERRRSKGFEQSLHAGRAAQEAVLASLPAVLPDGQEIQRSLAGAANLHGAVLTGDCSATVWPPRASLLYSVPAQAIVRLLFAGAPALEPPAERSAGRSRSHQIASELFASAPWRCLTLITRGGEDSDGDSCCNTGASSDDGLAVDDDGIAVDDVLTHEPQTHTFCGENDRTPLEFFLALQAWLHSLGLADHPTVPAATYWTRVRLRLAMHSERSGAHPKRIIARAMLTAASHMSRRQALSSLAYRRVARHRLVRRATLIWRSSIAALRTVLSFALRPFLPVEIMEHVVYRL